MQWKIRKDFNSLLKRLKIPSRRFNKLSNNLFRNRPKKDRRFRMIWKNHQAKSRRKLLPFKQNLPIWKSRTHKWQSKRKKSKKKWLTYKSISNKKPNKKTRKFENKNNS